MIFPLDTKTSFPMYVPRKPTKIIINTSGKYSLNEKPKKKKAMDLNKCWNTIKDPCVATCLIGLKFIFLIRVETNGPEAPKRIDITEVIIPPKRYIFFLTLEIFQKESKK